MYIYFDPVIVAFVAGCLIGGASIIVLAIAAQRREFKRAKEAEAEAEIAGVYLPDGELITAGQDVEQYNELRDKHREQWERVSKELQEAKERKL